MAKMIPSYLGEDTLSPGEVDFFKRINSDIKTKDWLVLHSLNIAHHQTRIMGEIDFLVIVPQVGILAVEIKAHSFIKVIDGIWYMGRSDTKGSRRSPFEQVNESMFSLINYISENNQNLKSLPIFSLVIFTHFDFKTKSIEWSSKDYVGSREYRSKPISDLLNERIKSRLQMASEKVSGRWLKVQKGCSPNKTDIKQLVQLIRPKIEPSETNLNIGSKIEKELIKYTSEQFLALDTLSGNKRVIFDGSAGTGKTFLAIESAMREAKVGKKVLLICMNKLLNSLLNTKLDNPDIKVVTLHKFLKDNSGSAEFENSNKYWDETLPEKAYCNLLEIEETLDKFDTLIIDEAQDILRNNFWLDCLDLILKEGLSNGRWMAFGDFNLQTIYNIYDVSFDIKDNLLSRTSSSAQASLTRNCRNTEECSRLSLSLAAIASPYQSYLRHTPSIVKSSYLFYKDELGQMKQLSSLIKKGLDSGFKASDIVILSKKAETKSISKNFSKELGISPFELERKGVSYTSIHKFKGLEAPFIILTDFDELASEEAKKMVFTGASRATDSVHYLFNNSTKASFLSLLMEGKGND
jgi:hypothetical protein